MSYIQTKYTVVCGSCGREGSYFGKRSIVREFDRADRTYRWTCCGARAELPPSRVTDTRMEI